MWSFKTTCGIFKICMRDWYGLLQFKCNINTLSLIEVCHHLVKVNLRTSQMARQTETYPGFRSMKRLHSEYFYTPLDVMLVHLISALILLVPNALTIRSPCPATCDNRNFSDLQVVIHVPTHSNSTSSFCTHVVKLLCLWFFLA